MSTPGPESADIGCVLLVGAGISKLLPSDVLDWWGFNSLLLECIKEKACQAAPESADLIASMGLDRIPVQAFSDRLVDCLAGPAYFPVLEVLDGTVTNVNHRAIAKLAATGKVTSVVTTNFDTLIERAFQEEGVALRVVVGIDQFEALAESDVCTLYKIHGSVERSATLVDTVTQKLLGLHPSIRNVLARVFGTQHTVVMGFSGLDLLFDDDYIPLASASQGGAVTWTTRQGQAGAIPPPVRRVSERLGDRFRLVEVDLPKAFELLGLSVDFPPADIHSSSKAGGARDAIMQWFTSPLFGAESCLSFLVALLLESGRREDAHSLAMALKPRLEGMDLFVRETDSLSVHMDPSIIDCAQYAAYSSGDFVAAEINARAKLKALRISQALMEAESGPDPETTRLYQSSFSATWNNIALGLRGMKRLDEAQVACEKALELALLAENQAVESYAHFAQTLIYRDRCDHPEKVLKELRACSRCARKVGHAKTLCWSELHAGEVLIDQAEYDAGLLYSAEAIRVADLIGDVHTANLARLDEARVLGLRGEWEAALKVYEGEFLRLHGLGHWSEAVAVLNKAVYWCAYSPPIRPHLRSMVAMVYNRVELADRSKLDGFLSMIGEETKIPPGFNFGPNLPQEEGQTRFQIAVAEQIQNIGLLPRLFDDLYKTCRETASSQRLRELAVGLANAAARAEDLQLHYQAHVYLGDFFFNSCSYQDAVEFYEFAYGVEGPIDRLEACCKACLVGQFLEGPRPSTKSWEDALRLAGTEERYAYLCRKAAVHSVAAIESHDLDAAARCLAFADEARGLLTHLDYSRLCEHVRQSLEEAVRRA